MPSRMIRESYLDSERYWSLTNDSERLLFHHLMSLADDFGCLSLAPAFIGRRAFGERPTDARLAKMLQALADADLIRIYENGAEKLGFIPRFRQKLQRFTLKHTQPPKQLYADDKHASEQFNKINDLANNPTGGQLVANVSPTGGHLPKLKGREVRREVEGKILMETARTTQAPQHIKTLLDKLPLTTKPSPQRQPLTPDQLQAEISAIQAFIAELQATGKLELIPEQQAKLEALVAGQ